MCSSFRIFCRIAKEINYHLSNLQKNLRRIFPTREPIKNAITRPPKKMMQERLFNHVLEVVPALKSSRRRRKPVIHNPRQTTTAVKDKAFINLPAHGRPPCQSMGSPKTRRLIFPRRLLDVFMLNPPIKQKY